MRSDNRGSGPAHTNPTTVRPRVAFEGPPRLRYADRRRPLSGWVRRATELRRRLVATVSGQMGSGFGTPPSDLVVFRATEPIGENPVDPASRIADVYLRRGSDVSANPSDAFDGLEPDDYVAMAAVDGDVVGWVFVRVERPVTVARAGSELRFDGPYLWGLFVDPDVRGRGIGSALVTAATRFGSVGADVPVYALVEAENGASRRLFERLAFEQVDCIRRRRRDGILARLRSGDPVREYGRETADSR